MYTRAVSWSRLIYGHCISCYYILGTPIVMSYCLHACVTFSKFKFCWNVGVSWCQKLSFDFRGPAYFFKKGLKEPVYNLSTFNPRNTSPFSGLEFEYRGLEFEYRYTENRVKRVPFSRNSVGPQTETRELQVVWAA